MDGSRLQNTPVVQLLRVLADLMGANLLFLLCSIPVFTIGASLSAMYAVLISRERNDGTVEVIKTFLRNFINGFGKATVLGLIVLGVSLVAAGDIIYGAASQPPMQTVFVTVGTIIAIIGLILFLLAFLQQSAYQNTVANYVMNSFRLVLCAPGRFILALAAWFLPWGLLLAIPEVFLINFGFLYLLWGFSFPAYITAKLFNGVFVKADKKEEDE